jgi:hypothetical protein
VFVLGEEEDLRDTTAFPQLRSLVVTNLQSFYNYQTVGPKFELYSSILSNNDNLLKMKVKDQGSDILRYTVLPEKTVLPDVTETTNIHLKKHRINSAFTIILNCDDETEVLKTRSENRLINSFQVNPTFKTTNDQQAERTLADNATSYFDYFSNEKNNVIETFPRDLITDMPLTCRPLPGSIAKPSCQNCYRICAFTMEALLYPKTEISTDDILIELSNHGHPTSKKIRVGQTERNRSKEEALRELINHYISIHQQQEPVFF